MQANAISAQRALVEDLHRQSGLLAGMPELCALYDAIIEAVVIVNRFWQIVFCNRAATEILGQQGGQILGLRPGEALNCAHACQTADGCGTTRFCVSCGAANSLLQSIRGQQATQECHILRDRHGETLDLLVRATPIRIGDEEFTIVAMRDISDESRRRTLERVFFHDVMNTVTGMQMLAIGLQSDAPEVVRASADGICVALRQLTDEITSQRDLTAAENNRLPVRPISIASMQLLESLVESFARPRSTAVRVNIEPSSADFVFVSDVGIITRVLGNMIKNAIEASEPGEAVTLACLEDGPEVCFRVHNRAWLPDNVQANLFKRAFSTKGTGRGLGTYSMKLLSEKYLKGKISFTTDPSSGTVFFARYPRTL